LEAYKGLDRKIAENNGDIVKNINYIDDSQKMKDKI